MRHLLLTGLCASILLVSIASAGTVSHKPSIKYKNMPGMFVFKASRGDVSFDHDQHLDSMRSEGCIPCHNTNSPKAGDIKTRFDERIAHYFCRGCHRDKEIGPTECHQCHAEK